MADTPDSTPESKSGSSRSRRVKTHVGVKVPLAAQQDDFAVRKQPATLIEPLHLRDRCTLRLSDQESFLGLSSCRMQRWLQPQSVFSSRSMLDRRATIGFGAGGRSAADEMPRKRFGRALNARLTSGTIRRLVGAACHRRGLAGHRLADVDRQDAAAVVTDVEQGELPAGLHPVARVPIVARTRWLNQARGECLNVRSYYCAAIGPKPAAFFRQYQD
jgi:hypothetical protein